MSANDERPGERRLLADRRGPRKPMYSGRVLAFTAAISAFVAALCSVIAILTISADTGNKTCRSRQAFERESNKRAPQHIKDAENLARLAGALSAHRKVEADTFEAIGRDFHISKEVRPLVKVLREGSRQDADIAAQERQVFFNTLPVDHC